MKHKTFALTLLALAAVAAGCDQGRSTSWQFEKVNAGTKAPAQDLKDYTFAQKAEFTEKMQGQLAEINKDLDELGARIEKFSDEVRAEARPKLRALREKTARLNQQLDEARNATESTWDSVKAGSRKSYDELKDGFKQARQWMSCKISP